MHATNRAGWLAPALALGALIALSPATAQAQTTGATTLTIDLPDIIVLHYFSEVDIDIDTATLEAYLDYADGDTMDEGSASDTSFTADLEIDPTDPTGDAAAVELTLANAWAVRAIGPTGTSTTVSVSSGGSLSHTSGDSIAIDSSEVQVSGGSGFGATAAFAPPGLLSPQVGDIQLVLDLTDATRSGAYAGTYTVSVSNL